MRLKIFIVPALRILACKSSIKVGFAEDSGGRYHSSQLAVLIVYDSKGQRVFGPASSE